MTSYVNIHKIVKDYSFSRSASSSAGRFSFNLLLATAWIPVAFRFSFRLAPLSSVELSIEHCYGHHLFKFSFVKVFCKKRNNNGAHDFTVRFELHRLQVLALFQRAISCLQSAGCNQQFSKLNYPFDPIIT